VAGFVGAFTGSHRFVLDYLVDEVLQQQPKEVRDFLVQTSVLERLSASLCDAVTRRADGARMLEILERANLFVIPLDEHRAWCRYHHLFADMLRARLLSEEPALVPALHLRASEWHERNGLLEDAVRHALAAPDFERATSLIEQALPALRRYRQDATLMGWLRALPDEVIRNSPMLCVFHGWSLMASGDLDAVQGRLDDAERALAASTPDPDNEELRTLPATLALYRAALAQARGDVPATARHARQALELSGPGDHLERGAAAGLIGLAAWADGDIEPALRTFTDAVGHLRAAGNATDELSGALVLADMWLTAGRPVRARTECERALHRATTLSRAQGAPLPVTADLHVGLGELHCERGGIAEARHHLETAEALGERAAMTENRHRWFLAMARVREAEGDPDGAIDLLDRGERLHRPGFFPDVRPVAAMKARIWITQGRLGDAAEWVSRRGMSTTDEPRYLQEFEHLTLVRLLLAQHREDPSAGTLSGAADLLDRLHEAAAPTGRCGSLLEIGMLQALAHQACGDRDRALEALERALDQTPEPEGYRRLLLDEGPPMVSLLRSARELGRLGGHVRRLLSAGPADEAASRSTPPPPVRGISARELQVLRLLDSSLSGPEIARELFVSLNTLRSHTKHIFTKLDVNSRSAAVDRAREHGLL